MPRARYETRAMHEYTSAMAGMPALMAPFIVVATAGGCMGGWVRGGR